MKRTRPCFRILLIEDNDDHAELVNRCFADNESDIELLRLVDGEAALDWFACKQSATLDDRERLPDLVLLDLRLPKVDGMEVLGYIKKREDLRFMPVVILSTSDADADIIAAYGSYANSYVVKPLDFDRLRATLNALGFYWLDINRQPSLT
jgi:DNA-binding response OmpR family regulator